MKFAVVNGQLVPAETAAVSIFDRGFLYGDGLFETLRVNRGRPWLWDEHWDRFSRGANTLRIALPFESAGVRTQADKLLDANDALEAVLRIHLSRGSGRRGYSPQGADSPTIVLSVHPLPPAPAAWKVATASLRLPPSHPLSAFKTTNKLLSIMAKIEAEEQGADEALLLSAAGEIAQGASSNIFWIQDQTIFTPPEATGILPGVTRAAVLRTCESLKLPVRQETAAVETLYKAAGVFMTLSTFGIVEVVEVNQRGIPRSEVTQEIQQPLTKG